LEKIRRGKERWQENITSRCRENIHSFNSIWEQENTREQRKSMSTESSNKHDTVLSCRNSDNPIPSCPSHGTHSPLDKKPLGANMASFSSSSTALPIVGSLEQKALHGCKP
jgi:hypothetical protein